MYDSTAALGFETIYVHLDDFCENRCPFCGSDKVIELYPDSGHTFQSKNGWKNLITYWCECLNPDCPGPNKFKAPHPYVLPYKKFGLDVWEFICHEVEKWNTPPQQLKERLEDVGVLMSTDTVADVIQTYKLLRENKADDQTRAKISAQGRIIVGCDGTPGGPGNPTFWIFYDVISGYLLYTAFLEHANDETLYDIFQRIAIMYEVPITGFLSDHQPSINNACYLYDPTLPHQTCHYHYLRNQWTFIETIDTHLNQELREIVNNLPILKRDANGGANYSRKIKVDRQEFFKPLAKLLKQAVNFKSTEFESCKSVLNYEALIKIVAIVKDELETCDPTLRPTIQLKTSFQRVEQGMDALLPYYHDICALNERFQEIRHTLEDPELMENDKVDRLEKIYHQLWDQYRDAAGYSEESDLVTIQPQYNLSTAIIFCQWYRLWQSHRADLFHYYTIDGMEKTNIYNEQIFSLVKSRLIKAHGVPHKNYMLMTRGEETAKYCCNPRQMSVHDILTRYDLKSVRELRAPLKTRIRSQRANFRNALQDLSIIAEIGENIRQKIWELKLQKRIEGDKV
jgi:hypothetical protein